MKKILFIILAVFIACKSRKEIIPIETLKNPNYKALKEFDRDTLRYLNTNFVAHKDFYIGKKLQVLLDDLELPINYYHFTSSIHEKNLSPDLGISTYKRNQINSKFSKRENPFLLYVTWETPLPSDKLIELSRKNNGNWTGEVRDYYKEFKIKEITVSNY